MSDPNIGNPGSLPLPPGKNPTGGYRAEIIGVQFGGPLPPPQILEAYERACPGAAHRIIELAEAQSEHRRRMEDKALEGQISAIGMQFRESRRGQIFAFCISAFFLACGSVVVLYGHPWPGSVFGTLGVGGIVTTFINGRENKKDSKTERTDVPATPAKRKRK
jgi:uncharacterized membrane protein